MICQVKVSDKQEVVFHLEILLVLIILEGLSLQILDGSVNLLQ